MENNEKRPIYEDRQNLPKITRITATHVGDVAAVLAKMQDCESIVLTDEQIKMGLDLIDSVQEHGVLCGGAVRVTYLIRYGMLLERQKGED